MKSYWIFYIIFIFAFYSLDIISMQHGDRGYHNIEGLKRPSSAPPQIPHTHCRNPLNAHELFNAISANKTFR